MNAKRCSTLLLLCVVSGCLQPVTPTPPAINTLEGVIRQALDEDRKSTSALATQVSLTPAEADQKTLWLNGRDKITTKSATIISSAIKDELDKAGKDTEAISNVWKEVAKGYGQ